MSGRPYLLELVRYIHLNPVRAKLVYDIDALHTYPFCGHSAIMGKVEREWQDADAVLSLFGAGMKASRRPYAKFVRVRSSKSPMASI